MLVFPSGKTLGLRFFSLNSRVILKSSRPKAENFSILLENLMKKNQNPSVFPDGNNNNKENLENYTLEVRDITFLHQ